MMMTRLKSEAPCLSRYFGLLSVFWLFHGFGLIMLARMSFFLMESEFFMLRLSLLKGVHAYSMIFMGVIPFYLGFIGLQIIPRQCGVTQNVMSLLKRSALLFYFVGSILCFSSLLYFFISADYGFHQVIWIVGFTCNLLSTVLLSLYFVRVMFSFKKPEVRFMQLPLFTWTLCSAALLLIWGFIPLIFLNIFNLFQVVTGEEAANKDLFWDNLFLFLEHPELYALILPAFGVVTEIVITHVRKKFRGYEGVVYSCLFLVLIALVLSLHHFSSSNPDQDLGKFFYVTLVIIFFPSLYFLAILARYCLKGFQRLSTALSFSVAFLVMFFIGGVSGLYLSFQDELFHLENAHYSIAHFHFLAAPSALFVLTAALYYWAPLFFRRQLSEVIGKWHFRFAFWGMLGVFLPMMLKGLLLPDGPFLQAGMGAGIVSILIAQVIFLWNLIVSMKKPAEETQNPWQAVTGEWFPERAYEPLEEAYDFRSFGAVK